MSLAALSAGLRRAATRGRAGVRLAVAGVLALGLGALLAPEVFGPATAEEPGDFDFYVLALSWSPSYCEAEGSERDRLQCGSGRPFAFVVHGLWPQAARGENPAFCDAADEPSRRTVDGVLDIMPSPGLVRHQWRKHGSCSGADPDDFFATVRAARERVAIPPAYRRLDRYMSVRPEAVEAAFVAANPGLAETGMAVTCDRHRLREVRICLTRDLDFRSCPEVDRRGCRQGSVAMPPVR